MMAIAPKEGRGRVRSSRHVLLKVGLRLEGIHPISPDGENFPGGSSRIHSVAHQQSQHFVIKPCRCTTA